jgi:hypothetical protein
MTLLLKHLFQCRCLFIAPIILLVSNNMTQAQGQVSSLQQLPPSGNPNQPAGNIIEKLFSNPAAAGSSASLYANPYSPYASAGSVSQFPSDFWGSLFHRHIVDTGTVLTGTLEDDLSSNTSKVGDVFSILLADGYKLNNEQLIPQNAKIVGTVVAATPASKKGNGIAGSVQISLQALVLPDGSSMPINAAIQYNPNQPAKFDITKGRGIPLGEYASSLEYSAIYAAGALTRQVGLPVAFKTQTGGGSDFILKQGVLLPVKLTQPLDMTAFVGSQSAQTLGNSVPNTMAPNTVPESTPGLPANNGQMPGSIPTLPANNGQMPNFNGAAGGQNNNWAMPGNQNPSYPGSWPNNQPAPYSNNTMPGNSSPAGPEPF